MLNMTNKFYNQMKSRLQRADQAPQNDRDVEKNAETAGPNAAGKQVDAHDKHPLRQVVVVKDPPRDLPRPQFLRQAGAPPTSHPPCPAHLCKLEEV